MLKLNPQVGLVPLEAGHAQNMFKWMCEPEVAANVGLRREPSLERTLEWIRNALADSSVRAFAIVAGERHVGNVVLDQIDRYLESARLSVYIGEAEFRGKGVGATGIYLALKAGFENERLNKVWLTVHVMNQAAIRVYTGLGFVIEGVLREEFWLDDRRLDVFRMSLLRREFLEMNPL